MSGIQEIDVGRWFPVCSRDDLQTGHIFETELLGRELAVWRSDLDLINVWENRCPHRGMRLTVGAVVGGELRCAYHGYRYAAGSGACTSIPAQPERAPPRILCIKTYPVVQSGPLIWTRLTSDRPAVEPPSSYTGAPLSLYAVTVRAPVADVASRLAGYRFRPSAALPEPQSAEESCSTSQRDGYRFQSVARKGHMTSEVQFFLQPVDACCTVVHGILCGETAPELRIPALKHHARQLTRLRDACEARSTATEPLPPRASDS